MCVCMCSYLSRDCGQKPDINNLRMENSIKACSLRGRSPSQEARHGSRCPHGVQSVWLWQDSSLPHILLEQGADRKQGLVNVKTSP